MPLSGVLGSDLLAGRDDWKVLPNPFSEVKIPSSRRRDFSRHRALPRALGRRGGNVWVGRRRELATIAHASKACLVTYEEMKGGDMLEDELLAPGVISATYVSALAPAKRGAWRSASRASTTSTTRTSRTTRAPRTREGFQRYLDEFVCIPEKSSRLRDRSPDRRRPARRRRRGFAHPRCRM